MSVMNPESCTNNFRGSSHFRIGTLFITFAECEWLLGFSIFSPVAEAKVENTEEGFLENLHAHLGCAENTVCEDDGYLIDLEAESGGCVLHLNLKGVADKLDLVELHLLRLQQTKPAVASHTFIPVTRRTYLEA